MRIKTPFGFLVRSNKGKILVDTLNVFTQRQRRSFDNIEQANAYAAELGKQVVRYGSEEVLSPLQVSDARLAYQILAGGQLTGVQLVEAARFYVQNFGTSGQTLQYVYDAWVRDKQGDGELREVYKSRLHHPLHQLLAMPFKGKQTYGKTVMALISYKHLEHYFNTVKGIEEPDKPLSPWSKHFRFRYIRNLWNYAKEKDHIVINPFEGKKLKAPKLPFKLPYILPIEKVEEMIRVAYTPQHRHFLAYMTLALFCGVRSEELRKLKWKDINIDEWTVMITPEVAKKKRHRTIPIPLNARLILEELNDTVSIDDPICNIQRVGAPRPDGLTNGCVNFWHHWRQYWKACGFKQWGTNACRHSYGSYLFRISGDNVHLVQDRMGHKQPETMFQHYVQSIRNREVALQYWLIGSPSIATKVKAAIAPYWGPTTIGKPIDWEKVNKILYLTR